MSSTKKRDFIRLADLQPTEYEALFARCAELKADKRARRPHPTLAGRTIALIFEKASTRTRVSFEAGMAQLGGHAVVLSPNDSQMGRGEPIEDTARVLSRYVDGIMLRTFADERLLAFAHAATVPVINGLSDGSHPVQLLADLFTVIERFGAVQGRKVAFVGDCASNMARSWIEAARLFDFELRLAAPEGYRPPAVEVASAGGRVRVGGDAREACDGADVINTDVWVSMGQETEKAQRLADLDGYCVDAKLVRAAAPNAIVLHCLPAHRGEEITAEVIDDPRSVIFNQAENRLHTTKALLELLLK